MKTKLWAVLAIAGTLALLSVPAFAHHGAAAYDTAKSVTVEGTVTDFQFTNPHVIISMEVKDDKGAVQMWQGELTSPNHLSRAGWSRVTLKPGDHITMIGNPAKSGANSVWIRKLNDAQGKPISTGGGEDISPSQVSFASPLL